MDDLARRREARRQKILQNSQDRLGKITGIEQKSCWSPQCPDTTATPTELPPEEPLLTPQINSIQSHKQTPISSEHSYRHLVIIGLALFVHSQQLILEHLFRVDLGQTHLDKIFLPLLMYEIVDLIAGKKEPPSRNFLQSLLLVAGKNSPVAKISKHMEVASEVIQDVMIYFFFYVCCEFVKDLCKIVLR